MPARCSSLLLLPGRFIAVWIITARRGGAGAVGVGKLTLHGGTMVQIAVRQHLTLYVITLIAVPLGRS